MSSKRFQIGFFASGRGSNFSAVLKKMDSGELPADPSFLLSNNSGSPALELARANKIPAYHVSRKTEGSEEGVAAKMLEVLEAHRPGLLILAGYMKPAPPEVLRFMGNKVINIHPALLPAFSGQGWYGMRIHEGVIQRGCQYTGITIHGVNGIYDEGPIILQVVQEVDPDDTPESLASKVMALEHANLWKVAKACAEGQLAFSGEKILGTEVFRKSLAAS